MKASIQNSNRSETRVYRVLWRAYFILIDLCNVTAIINKIIINYACTSKHKVQQNSGSNSFQTTHLT